MYRPDQRWKSTDLANVFLKRIRGAMPLAEVHLDIIRRLANKAKPKIGTFLDIGCGDGVVGRSLYKDNATALGVFLDFSEPMLNAVSASLKETDYKHEIIESDISDPAWVGVVKKFAPFDVIVSGFAIHHQPDSRKNEIYQEVFNLLSPGGIFLNLENVSSSTEWTRELFEEFYADSIKKSAEPDEHESITVEAVRKWRGQRVNKLANLSPVEDQLAWLIETGFSDVDCYFKLYEQAIIGGARPSLPE